MLVNTGVCSLGVSPNDQLQAGAAQRKVLFTCESKAREWEDRVPYRNYRNCLPKGQIARTLITSWGSVQDVGKGALGGPGCSTQPPSHAVCFKLRLRLVPAAFLRCLVPWTPLSTRLPDKLSWNILLKTSSSQKG